MGPSFLGKQAAGCNSPQNWLMSLAVDLATLCDIMGAKIAPKFHFRSSAKKVCSHFLIVNRISLVFYMSSFAKNTFSNCVAGMAK